MEARQLREILEIMCAPENTDAPQEGDFVPRSIEGAMDDELFIRSWIAKREREIG